MAVDIVATVGSANANSFVTPDEMTLYCDGRLNSSAWNPDDETKLAALVEATMELNVLPWLGARATTTQALAWPRSDVADPDLNGVNDGLTFDILRKRLPVDYDPDIVPKRVKDATCELALQFLKAGTSDIASVDANAGVIRKKVGPLETEWADTNQVQRIEGLAKFQRVWRLLNPLLKKARGGTVELMRV